MKHKLLLIEAPSNLGLIEPSPGKEPGVGRLPEWLRLQGLYDYLNPHHVVRIDPPPYEMKYDETTGVRNPLKIIDFSIHLAEGVARGLQSHEFTFVIGGDCSILIGCALGLRKIGKYGLVYIDGHTDFVLPPSSLTKGAAGMDLAIVTGHGHDLLTNIHSLKPYLCEQDVIAIGNREYDSDYVKQIMNSQITYIDLENLRKTGIENAVADFLKKAEFEKLDGFWVHLDVDVLDDNIMPCVDSRQPGGLSYGEFHVLMKLLLQSPLAKGINLTILDPDLDTDGKYTKEFIKRLAVTTWFF